MTALLAVSGLAVLRGERLLFRDIEFALNAGDCLLIEGANGSGKTSLLRVVAGLMPPDSGEIRWRGSETRLEPQVFRAALAWHGHKSGLKQDLTLIENLRCEAALRPTRSLAPDDLLGPLALSALTELPLRVLSAGQQRRVALARLLMTDVPLWLLDEPFTNLDRAGQALVNDLVRRHLAQGGVCVMAAHRGVSADLPTARLSLS